jgi:hypothetical protein
MALNQLRGASKRDCEQKCGNAKALHRGLLDCVQLLRLLSIDCRTAHEKTINITAIEARGIPACDFTRQLFERPESCSIEFF